MNGSHFLPCGTGGPQVVDHHSLICAKLPKAACAVMGADWMDGLAVLANPTTALASSVMGVSMTYIGAAKRLSPEQREQVIKGLRPLIIRSAPKQLPLSLAMPIPSAEEQLRQIVAEVGLPTVLRTLGILGTLPVAA